MSVDPETPEQDRRPTTDSEPSRPASRADSVPASGTGAPPRIDDASGSVDGPEPRQARSEPPIESLLYSLSVSRRGLAPSSEPAPRRPVGAALDVGSSTGFSRRSTSAGDGSMLPLRDVVSRPAPIAPPAAWQAVDQDLRAPDDPFLARGYPAEGGRRRLPWVAAFVIGLGVSGVTYGLWNRAATAPAPPPASTGKATITSQPDGLQVVIDDQVRGITPLTLTLPVGSHQMRIQAGQETRSFPLVIDSAKAVSQYIQLDGDAPAPGTGGLEVTSDPPGASVTIDGVAAGKTPLSLARVAAGERRIVVGSGDQAVTRTVTVRPGSTATAVVATGSRARSAGWAVFKAPFDMQVLENGRAIGTTAADRVMLSAGSHQLELRNEQLEFRSTLRVQIAAGVATTQTVTVPDGSLSVNAVPWADVTIDGRPAGTTPLGNLAVTPGRHEIVWTHPQLGERRQTVTVTTKTPARVGIDFAR